MIVLLACAMLPLVQIAAGDPPLPAATYVSGGTAVVRAADQTILDAGGVVCTDTTGIGGACIATPGGSSPGVLVVDAVSGTDVAFQVCADNNGDGLCTAGQRGPCADSITFSHDDDVPVTYNPVAAPSINTLSECAYPGFLVVFLCEGIDQSARDDGGLPHFEGPATTGLVAQAHGTGSGNFCMPPASNVPVSKPYVYVDDDVL